MLKTFLLVIKELSKRDFRDPLPLKNKNLFLRRGAFFFIYKNAPSLREVNNGYINNIIPEIIVHHNSSIS